MQVCCLASFVPFTRQLINSQTFFHDFIKTMHVIFGLFKLRFPFPDMLVCVVCFNRLCKYKCVKKCLLLFKNYRLNLFFRFLKCYWHGCKQMMIVIEENVGQSEMLSTRYACKWWLSGLVFNASDYGSNVPKIDPRYRLRISRDSIHVYCFSATSTGV